jgi:hypothetical protein
MFCMSVRALRALSRPAAPNPDDLHQIHDNLPHMKYAGGPSRG